MFTHNTKTMTKRFFLLSLLCVFAGLTSLSAQGTTPPEEKPAKEKTKQAASSAPTPKNMFEVGINGGLSMLGGDVKPLPSYGIGIHVRKALDYIFSLRGDFLLAKLKGADETTAQQVLDREFETDWKSGTVFGVLSLNSLHWNKPVRSTNIYVMVGGGGNSYNVEYQSETVRKGTYKSGFSTHMALGAGLSVRASNRINIGLEQQVFAIFGSNADLVDGIFFDKGQTQEKSIFRDVLSFTNLTVNFNLGNPATQSEPLYWINPLETVMNDIEALKNRPEVSLEDADQDGVIDALDQELSTPAGAMVDTKGRTLDSDRDGVPDYLDREPFYTPGENERVNSEGVVINPSGRGGVTEERVRELIDEALQSNGTLNDVRSTAAEWFLPMIHFGTDSYSIKYSDYGNLASIARTLRSNPSMRLVVTGYADATGAETYNNQLSYSRAKAVIDHLVTVQNIGRGRFVLQWKGSNESLVPSNASYMNRRVELRVAGAGDVEMDPPSGKTDGY